MATPERYLARAAELEIIATRAVNPVVQLEWRSMAAAYKMIAEMVEQPHLIVDEPVEHDDPAEHDADTALAAISTQQKNSLMELARSLETALAPDTPEL
jgi:hypothetical protein